MYLDVLAALIQPAGVKSGELFDWLAMQLYLMGNPSRKVKGRILRHCNKKNN